MDGTEFSHRASSTSSNHNMSNNHNEKQYRCVECRQTVQEGVLPLHLLIHLEGKLSDCESCVLGFERQESLTQHLLQHAGNILHMVKVEDPLHSSIGSCYETQNTAQDDGNHGKIEISNQDVIMLEDGVPQQEPAYEESISARHEKRGFITKRPYTCKRCPIKKFLTYEELIKHLEVHTPWGRTCQCDFCGKSLKTEAERLIHRTSLCKVCGKRFLCESYLTTHMASHTGGFQHRCDVCGTVLISSEALVEHKEHRSHHHKHICRYCGQSCRDGKLLTRHEVECKKEANKMLSSEPHSDGIENVPIICQCNKRFAKRQAYLDHQCSKKELYRCKTCGQTFYTTALLKCHEDQCHTEKDIEIVVPENSYKCTICICQFETEPALKSHMETHKIDYHCKCCGMDFHNAWEKENHIDVKCKICGTAFVCKIRVAGHEASHTGKIHCSICGTIFSNATEKHAHRNVKCQTCGRTFTCNTLLAIHDASHTRIVQPKPLPKKTSIVTHQQPIEQHLCIYCGKTYASVPSLRKHQNEYHEDEMESIAIPDEVEPIVVLDETTADEGLEGLVVTDKKYECTSCKLKYDSKQTLQAHMETHKLNYHCRCCLTDFYNAWEKHKHTSCRCKVCGMTFVCKTRLTSHEAGHGQHCSLCGIDLHTVEAKRKHQNSECKICGRSFGCAVLLTPHEKSHHKSGPHACAVCGKAFAQLQTLTNHQYYHRTHHRCKDCGKTFPNIFSLSKHNAEGHDEEEDISPDKAHECSACKLLYETEADLQAHILTHKERRFHNFYCGLCKKRFNDMWENHKHKNAKCKICGKLFTCESHLAAHTAAHDGRVPHKCDICGMVLLHSDALIAHMKRFHREPHICKHCGEIFTRVEILKRHQRQCQVDGIEMLSDSKKKESTSIRSKSTVPVTHPSKNHPNKEGEPWACGKCTKIFASAKGVAEHLKTHESDTFHCTICTSYTCKTEQELKLHMKSHLDHQHDVKQVKAHVKLTNDRQCEKCGKVFWTELQKHKHAKSECKVSKVTYKCDICDEVFTQKLALAEHKHTHFKEMHQCKYCSKTYLSTDELQRHEYWFHEKNNANSQPEVNETASVSSECLYKCGECPETFDSRIKLVRHQLMHKLQS